MPADPDKRMSLPKTRTHINGFDEITGGGVPTGRPTLVCGSAGCGKTLFGMEFLARGAVEDGEPGVLFSFEEREQDIAANVMSLGFDVPELIANNHLRIDEIRIDAAEIAETGDYSLDGLFLRMQAAVEEIGARRVVLDTIENLFAGLSNHAILRSELNRLFRWLKDRELTAVITAERGRDTLTRYGIEEYVSDCVVVLDHRVNEQVSTRRLRILKYRGTSHGTNEYPFLIDKSGISIVPITGARLDHPVTSERITSGIAGIDEMLHGAGYYAGSTVLISGTSGTGKSSMAINTAYAAAQAGKRSLIFSFEESPQQIVRNMLSIGIELQPLIDSKLLRIRAARPSVLGLEQHLLQMIRELDQFNPDVVVIDPISSFANPGASMTGVSLLVVRLIDALKSRGITALLTYLASSCPQIESTIEGISSISDTWLLLQLVEHSGERNRTIHVLKSRGMEHSNQVREFTIGAKSFDFIQPYLGPDQVLTGTARFVQEVRDRAAHELRRADVTRKRQAHKRLQKQMEAEISSLTSRFETQLDALRQELAEAERLESLASTDHNARAAMRGAKNKNEAEVGG